MNKVHKARRLGVGAKHIKQGRACKALMHVRQEVVKARNLVKSKISHLLPKNAILQIISNIDSNKAQDHDNIFVMIPFVNPYAYIFGLG